MDRLRNVGDIRKLQMDVNSDDSVGAVVKAILDAEGRIDILINNTPATHSSSSGILCIGEFRACLSIGGTYSFLLAPILNVSVETAEETFQTNMFAIPRFQCAVVPHMAARRNGLVI